jgi:hypothetical protein
LVVPSYHGVVMMYTLVDGVLTCGLLHLAVVQDEGSDLCDECDGCEDDGECGFHDSPCGVGRTIISGG